MPRANRPHPIASIEFFKKRKTSATGELVVYFTSGGSYTYERVPEKVVEEFKKAASQGTYFNDNIRGKYGG